MTEGDQQVPEPQIPQSRQESDQESESSPENPLSSAAELVKRYAEILQDEIDDLYKRGEEGHRIGGSETDALIMDGSQARRARELRGLAKDLKSGDDSRTDAAIGALEAFEARRKKELSRVELQLSTQLPGDDEYHRNKKITAALPADIQKAREAGLSSVAQGLLGNALQDATKSNPTTRGFIERQQQALSRDIGDISSARASLRPPE